MAGTGIAWARTNVANREQAVKMVRAVLDERLAACANMGEIYSSFWWAGKTKGAHEVAIVFKTSRARLPALVARVRELHGYKVPYVAWGRGEQVTDAYAAWVTEEVRPRGLPARRGSARRGCRATRSRSRPR